MCRLLGLHMSWSLCLSKLCKSVSSYLFFFWYCRVQLVCGQVENSASVLETFWVVTNSKLDFGHFDGKIREFFCGKRGLNYPKICVCMHCVCVCVCGREKRDFFIFLAQQLEWFGGWSWVRTDLACPAIKGPADKTAEWWHIVWTALFKLATEIHVLTKPFPAAIVWFLDIKSLYS